MVRVLVLWLGRSAAAEQVLSGLLDSPLSIELGVAHRSVGAQLLCFACDDTYRPRLVFWCGISGVERAGELSRRCCVF